MEDGTIPYSNCSKSIKDSWFVSFSTHVPTKNAKSSYACCGRKRGNRPTGRQTDRHTHSQSTVTLAAHARRGLTTQLGCETAILVNVKAKLVARLAVYTPIIIISTASSSGLYQHHSRQNPSHGCLLPHCHLQRGGEAFFTTPPTNTLHTS